MITVTAEPYVLCSKCEDTSRCEGMYTCEVTTIEYAIQGGAIKQAVKRGGWVMLGDDIYCPHCAAVVGKAGLKNAMEVKDA